MLMLPGINNVPPLFDKVKRQELLINEDDLKNFKAPPPGKL